MYIYLRSFPDNFLDFLYSMACIFIFDGVTVRTENGPRVLLLFTDTDSLCYGITTLYRDMASDESFFDLADYVPKASLIT